MKVSPSISEAAHVLDVFVTKYLKEKYIPNRVYLALSVLLEVVECCDCVWVYEHDGICECAYCGTRSITDRHGFCHRGRSRSNESYTV